MFYYTGDADESYYGWSYNAYAGDFNGDGQTDLALGSMFYDGSDGALHIVYGGGFDSLISTGDEYHLGAGEENSDYYMLGTSGSADALSTNVIAGDVTGDGYDDLIVTASGANSGYGATYLWVGGATTTYYADTDGDSYGDSGSSIQNTSLPTDYVENADDCDDTDSAIYDGATELGDAIDNDCDSRIDEGLVTANISSYPSSVTAGDSIDIDYDVTNNSGLTDFEVKVLLNNDVVGTVFTYPRRIELLNICTLSRCTELSSETITAAVSGATTSDRLSATIPATTTAGDYTIRIRIHDATTDQYFTRDLETITVY
jgi:hypothetical protein